MKVVPKAADLASSLADMVTSSGRSWIYMNYGLPLAFFAWELVEISPRTWINKSNHHQFIIKLNNENGDLVSLSKVLYYPVSTSSIKSFTSKNVILQNKLHVCVERIRNSHFPTHPFRIMLWSLNKYCSPKQGVQVHNWDLSPICSPWFYIDLKVIKKADWGVPREPSALGRCPWTHVAMVRFF